MRKQGNHWSLEVTDGVLVARFEEGIDFDAFGAEAFPAFKELLAVHGDDIVGSANLVAVDEHLDNEVYEVWEAAAEEYSELSNYQRGAFVANGITRFSLKSSLEVPGAENKAFDDFETATQWARTGTVQN